MHIAIPALRLRFRNSLLWTCLMLPMIGCNEKAEESFVSESRTKRRDNYQRDYSGGILGEFWTDGHGVRVNDGLNAKLVLSMDKDRDAPAKAMCIADVVIIERQSGTVVADFERDKLQLNKQGTKLMLSLQNLNQWKKGTSDQSLEVGQYVASILFTLGDESVLVFNNVSFSVVKGAK